MLLGKEPEADQEHLREALMLLFPQLQNVFTNARSDPDTGKWTRQRRACLKGHFDKYFRFCVSHESVPREEIDYLLDERRTSEEIQKAFHEALDVIQAKGRTKASYLLDELNFHGPHIPMRHGELILSAVFGIADDLFVQSDEDIASGIDNRSRIHRLIRSILFDRTTLRERSDILYRALENAAIEWNLDFSRRAWENLCPSNPEREAAPEAETLVTERTAHRLRTSSLNLIRGVAEAGMLLDCKNALRSLFEWDVFKPKGSSQVIDFTRSAFDDDRLVGEFAHELLGKAHCHGTGGFDGLPGNPVHEERDHAQIDDIRLLIDIDFLRQRLTELADDDNTDEDDKDAMRRLLAVWDKRDAGDDWSWSLFDQ